jgi:hypothetical protein
MTDTIITEKTIFDLKLPEGSRCTSMAVLDPLLIAAAFSIPGEQPCVYILNPNRGTWQKMILGKRVLDQDEL